MTKLVQIDHMRKLTAINLVSSFVIHAMRLP
jgi:hypothetical protein